MANRTVAAVQMVSGADVADNLEAAAALIKESVTKGAALVVLPENFAVLDSGPLARHAEVEGDTNAPLQGFLASQAAQYGIHLVGGTIPLKSRPGSPLDSVTDGRVRPASLVYGPDGVLMGRYDKIHLFDVEVEDKQAQYSESMSFEPGTDVVVVDTPVATLGLSICYDLRFPELYRRLLSRNAEIVTVPSAFTRVTGEAHWEVLLRARAIENQVYVIAPNQGGRHNDKRETWGHSMIVDPWGRVLSVLDQGEGVVVAELELDALHELRRRMPVSSHRRM